MNKKFIKGAVNIKIFFVLIIVIGVLLWFNAKIEHEISGDNAASSLPPPSQQESPRPSSMPAAFVPVPESEATAPLKKTEGQEVGQKQKEIIYEFPIKDVILVQ